VAGDAGSPTGSNRGLWARFIAASLLIVVSMATATAVSLLVYLTDIAKGLGDLKGVKSQLSLADASDPQTILILGSDQRPTDTSARSDTTILLRVTPEQINLLSIPRDLKVNIPGFGIDKLNAAYSYGGPKLTVKVVKQLTNLDINHVVNVDFTGFADAVDAIDCVYIDVDHHYYHSNLGLAAAEQYAEIDIPAGYQRMCGYKALQYVRYRHEDNDLVRSARQQSFLREARQAVPTSKLLNPFSDKRNQLIDIFTKYTTSDIDSGKTLIGLLKLFLKARNAQVREIHFPADIGGPTSTYVTASQADIQKAVAEFLGETPAPQPAPVPEKKPSGNKGGGGPSKPPPPPPMDDSSAMGLDYAGRHAATKTKSGKPMLDFPILYPTRLVPGSLISDDSRAFPIDGPGSAEYRGYKMVFTLGGAYTQYYGLSGTDWKDPPILDNPSEERVIRGRNYLLFYDGGRLRQVGWRTEKGSYWVSNTLVQSLSEPQMLAVAESMREFNG
jgi:LCP family protein required for cell wall assembly